MEEKYSVKEEKYSLVLAFCITFPFFNTLYSVVTYTSLPETKTDVAEPLAPVRICSMPFFQSLFSPTTYTSLLDTNTEFALLPPGRVCATPFFQKCGFSFFCTCYIYIATKNID